ncbi:glycerophosphodiester phosphodiesterase family protein [Paenibacillus sp. MMS18-CY102]|uniref:glycerophosphodiester phosphodiesterase family protein n=1 Tax=Paenibacillus sp. MMS18-CY102 TaxID=2682849 RepID=UPI001F269717|nr:glycerophosphodiester phosphodiesterase family protein [Paenibacillus sp. MMS18-CY102]
MHSIERESMYIAASMKIDRGMNEHEKNVYRAYAKSYYRRNRIRMKLFTDMDVSRNCTDVYFHDPTFIPYFKMNRHEISVIEGVQLADYLNGLAPDCWVWIAVKDEGSQAVDDMNAARLANIGITQLDRSKLRHSYVWIGHKQEDGTYEVLYEQCSPEAINVNEECLKSVSPHTFTMTSQGALSGNSLASIVIDGIEYSSNQRGINMVTYTPSLQLLESNVVDSFVTMYLPNALYRAVPPIRVHPHAWVDRASICHAGGEWEGIAYTNCLEALEFHYVHRGHRVFELDFELTSDGELVARHDWSELLYGHLKQQRPEGVQPGQPMTHEQFRSTPILGRFTPLTAHDVMAFLHKYTDAYLVTDTKHFDMETVRVQFQKLVQSTESYDDNVLSRIVPQLYREEMYDVVEQVHSFPSYIYTLYQTDSSDAEVVEFVQGKPILAVAMTPQRYNRKLGDALHRNGVRTFLHTVNVKAELEELIDLGADGFYTDRLDSYSIKEIVQRKRVATETKLSVIYDLLSHRFGNEAMLLVPSLQYIRDPLMIDAMIMAVSNANDLQEWLTNMDQIINMI